MGGLFRLIHKRYSPSIPRPARPVRLRERPLRPAGIALPRAYSRRYGQIRKCADTRERAGMRGIRRGAWIFGGSDSHYTSTDRGRRRSGGGKPIAAIKGRRTDTAWGKMPMRGRDKGERKGAEKRGRQAPAPILVRMSEKQLAPIRVAEISLPREADREQPTSMTGVLAETCAKGHQSPRRTARRIWRGNSPRPGEENSLPPRQTRERKSAAARSDWRRRNLPAPPLLPNNYRKGYTKGGYIDVGKPINVTLCL